MSDDKTRWARVREIFEAVLASEVGDRDELLSKMCGSDSALRQEVEALLAASEDDDFLSTPRASLAAHAMQAVRSDDQVGTRVGPYRLVERLGQGGMGEVFAADRADGAFEQRVAVKLIRATFPTDDLVRRFKRERDILASLNHPNIAHLLDGGVSDSGPYIAMEFVDGEPILAYCDGRKLGIKDRLELFATVCDAVHFAHQKLVVHRDLKPSNVLVTAEGRAKLLDFGIAGLLGDEGPSVEPLTRTGLRLMTPEYGSPEQIRGESVSTASDIYTLGVLLYELLTGQRPYDLTGLSPAAVERRIVDEPPTRPSDAVAPAGSGAPTRAPADPEALSLARSTKPDRLKRSLRGDLDTIILKAMQRDPSRRYESAAELAADLRRHLADKPVLARPDTLAYRLSTAVRRHRLPLAAGALVAFAILAGSVATAYQAQRAETRFDDTRNLANSMLFELHEALEDLPGATPVRAMLVTQALTYLDVLTRDQRADPELLLEVADAYAKIGAIQGNPYYTNLGDVAAAKSSYQEAFRIRESVWIEDTTRVGARIALADSYGQLSAIVGAEGDMAESVRLSTVGLALLEPLGPVGQEDDALAEVDGRVRSLHGGNLIFEGEFDDGLREVEIGVAHLERVAAGKPDDLTLRLDLWQAYTNQLDGWRFSMQFRPALAVLEERACPMLEALAELYPTRASVLYGLHECYDYLGLIEEHLGDPSAEDSYRKALEMAETLASLDPANVRANEAISTALVSIGRLVFRLRGAEEGRPPLERALEVRQAMRAQHPSNDRWTRSVASVLRELCRWHVNVGEPQEALRYCGDAVATHELSAGAGAVAQATLAYALGHSARAHRDVALRATAASDRQRSLETSIELYQRSIAAYEAAGEFPEDTAWEIHPDSMAAELAALQGRGRPVT